MKEHKKEKPILGVLTSWFQGPYQHELVSGIEWEARQKKVIVLYFPGRSLHSPDPSERLQNKIFELVPQELLQGLIVAARV